MLIDFKLAYKKMKLVVYRKSFLVILINLKQILLYKKLLF